MRFQHPEFGRSMTPAEVGELFGVGRRTVWMWADKGRLPEAAIFYTPGGHLRLWEKPIMEMLERGENT